MYEENRAPKGKGEIGKIQEEMAIAHSRASYKSSYNGKKGKEMKREKKNDERKDQRKRPCANDCVESSQRRTDVNAPKNR